MYGIYQWKCIPTGELYIGQSIHLDTRKDQHIKALRKGIHKNHKLQEAFSLYGESAFDFMVIAECPVDMLNHLEDYYIKKYDTINNGFNIQSGTVKYQPEKLKEESVLSTKEEYLAHRGTDYIDSLFNAIIKKYDRISRRPRESISSVFIDVKKTLKEEFDMDCFLELTDRLHLELHLNGSKIDLETAYSKRKENNLLFDSETTISFYNKKCKRKRT